LPPKELKYRRDTDQKQIEIQQRIAAFTGHLVIVGFLQVLIAGIGLAGILISNKAANAAKVSAEATMDAVKLARDNARIELRAWGTVEIAPVRIIADKPSRFTIQVKNHGRTPAQLKQIIVHEPVLDDIFPTPDLDAKPTGNLPTGMTIQNNDNFNDIRNIEPMPEDRIKAVENKDAFLLIYGAIFTTMFSAIDTLRASTDDMFFWMVKAKACLLFHARSVPNTMRPISAQIGTLPTEDILARSERQGQSSTTSLSS
jgi:hypothetical protein